MRLGVMQPYFFPYLGYFDLIRNTDHWIIFDTPQYIRHGWINRNRILHPKTGWQYVIVPLCKHGHRTPIKDIHINNQLRWQETLIGQLTHYKRRAPFYSETVDLVMDCLAHPEPSIARLNGHILEKICARLGIAFHHSYFSDLDLNIGETTHPVDWALRISAAVGADEYVNPPGGEGLFDRAAFAAHSIRLTIRHPPQMEYTCRGWPFESALSVIDVLMWNSAETVKTFLDQHALPKHKVSQD